MKLTTVTVTVTPKPVKATPQTAVLLTPELVSVLHKIHTRQNKPYLTLGIGNRYSWPVEGKKEPEEVEIPKELDGLNYGRTADGTLMVSGIGAMPTGGYLVKGADAFTLLTAAELDERFDSAHTEKKETKTGSKGA